MHKRIITHVVLLSACVIFFYYSGIRLDIAKTSNILSSLQNIMSAIFALTGIWLAISYPEAINSYINPKKVSLLKGSERTKRIEKITLTIFGTAYALVFSLLIQWANVIFEELLTKNVFENVYTIVCSSLLAYISIIVIRGLLAILFINFQIANDLHDKKDEAEAIKDLSD